MRENRKDTFRIERRGSAFSAPPPSTEICERHPLSLGSGTLGAKPQKKMSPGDHWWVGPSAKLPDSARSPAEPHRLQVATNVQTGKVSMETPRSSCSHSGPTEACHVLLVSSIIIETNFPSALWDRFGLEF